jgi:hypothetical protein
MAARMPPHPIPFKFFAESYKQCHIYQGCASPRRKKISYNIYFIPDFLIGRNSSFEPLGAFSEGDQKDSMNDRNKKDGKKWGVLYIRYCKTVNIRKIRANIKFWRTD